jgi:L,D-transpeptidase ErfK/SrfK
MKYMACILLVTANLFIIIMQPTSASSFIIPSGENALIGNIKSTQATSNDTPTTLAQRYNIGLNAVVNANPGATEQTLTGGYVKIPTAFILPALPHKGIIINLAEMRMYYYPEGTGNVMTFPVGIGKIGKTIPIQNTVVTRKAVNPVWIPPPDIRKYNREQGIELPYKMEAGPDNPLGPYAIYLRIPTYLIHSTIFPESIGRRASFGCIRMNEGDIKEFFPLVKPGTFVAIINMPNKVGWDQGRLYLEAHPPLEEHDQGEQTNLNNVLTTIANALPSHGITLVDWQLAAYILQQPDGIPHEIGIKIPLTARS